MTAEIASPNGTLKNGLFIREEVLDALYKNGNVKDVKEIVELLGKVKNDKNTFPDQEKADTKQEVIPATEETKIWGVSSEACTKKIAENQYSGVKIGTGLFLKTDEKSALRIRRFWKSTDMNREI